MEGRGTEQTKNQNQSTDTGILPSETYLVPILPTKTYLVPILPAETYLV